MSKELYDVVIAGCGLSGLTAAHEILKKNPDLKICLIEARARFGGRLKTVFTPSGKEVDVGGSWVCVQAYRTPVQCYCLLHYVLFIYI